MASQYRQRPDRGKETPFVLDFVNDPDDIRAAFEPYYNTAELTDISDPNVVYDLLRKLNEVRIYEWHEVERFAEAFFDPKANSSKLSYWVEPARQRFKAQWKGIGPSLWLRHRRSGRG